ncbi:transmembrane protein 81 [Rhineura floridana]|uniref:transmembrane protein 81 n=1 Tax=Rhineura floridana TaxID=261503 RepID=UPI002AC7F472|nr:transmembrane protein 81 [Rhineura floridana]
MITETGLALGILAFAFFVPLSVTSHEAVTIPKQLRTAAGRVAVSCTSCSVTCGLGYKIEETCEVRPDGQRRDCTKQKVDCLTNWICGMRHFTVLVGKPFEFSCLTTGEIGPQTQSFSYTWRLARGIITTDDVLFVPFKNPGFVIKLFPAEEYDAGTYRCDVQLMKNYMVVKRIYFGLRVIPGDLVDLSFDKSLTLEQQLESENEKNQQNITNIPVQERWHSWRQRAVLVFLIGIGSGVVGGVLLHTLLYCVLKDRSKHKNYERVEDRG